jgi:hypothetical protein
MAINKTDKSIKASEIKKVFNNQFPFLKIEFFKKKHKSLQGSLKKELIVDDFNILNIQNVIEFKDDMLVSELENLFEEKFKLSVQVFRKSGKSWLETTFTDGWSLKKQNQEGLDLSQI